MKCNACKLACGGKLNCVDGWGNPNARLIIYLECPGSYQAEKLLIWMIWKLSLTENDVYIDYMVKCPTRKEDKKKELREYTDICWSKHSRNGVGVNVLSGNETAEFLGKAKIKEWNGRKHPETGNWIVYSFDYLLMKSAECVSSWRVLFKAAEEAGLKPKMNKDLEVFKFPTKKLK